MEIYLISMINLAVFISTMLICTQRYGTITKPPVFFTGVWTFVAILSLCRITATLMPRVDIYYYIIIGDIAFTVNYMIFQRNGKKLKLSKNVKTQSLNIRRFKMINYIVIAIYIPLFILGAISIINGSIFAIRYQREDVLANLYNTLNFIPYSNYIIDVFISSFPMGILLATSSICAVELLKGNKRLLKITIVEQLMYIVIYGGRIVLFRFAIYIVIAYLIYGNRSKEKRRLKKRYIIVIAIAILLITIFRGASKYSFIQWFSLYFVGPLSFFEYILQNSFNYALNSQYTYGMLTFGFIFEPIMMLLKVVAGLNMDVPSAMINIYTQIFVPIGINGITYPFNNSTTMYYTFLRDFGILGVWIGPAILGVMMAITQNRITRYNSARNEYLLIYLYGVVFTGIMAYGLTALHATFSIAFIIFVTNRSKTVKADDVA